MIQNPCNLHKILLEEFGHQNWWPIDKKYHEKNKSDPRFEIIIGAILTQNTAWSNVEKAIDNLKSKNMLEIKKISNADIRLLRNMIKPSGFFNQKAHRLKNIARFLHEKYDDDLDMFFNRDIKEIRAELLSLNGIGPETADSILLYAGELPIFVVDAYTKRLCKRIPFNTGTSYDEIQQYFQEEIKKKYNENSLTQVYNELHALIVVLAKKYCKKKPDCKNCPINKNCGYMK
ncbi:MAG: endonuclease [Candidatus Thermoplasmatota archaeon]|jgi:endonuclease-3 related protein|nr:endonuclease [Candidatus Thermoplasmatota archaeon]